MEKHLETFVAAGLQGLEAMRPGVPSKLIRYYRKVAKRHGLFLTAGSDWHGWNGVELGLFFAHRTDLMGFISALRYAA